MKDDVCLAVAVNHRQEPALFCWLKPDHPGWHLDREHKVKWYPEEPGDPAGVPAVMKPPAPADSGPVFGHTRLKQVKVTEPVPEPVQLELPFPKELVPV